MTTSLDWLTAKAQSSDEWRAIKDLPLVKQLASIAADAGLHLAVAETFLDGTVEACFAEPCLEHQSDRFLAITVDNEGADIDAQGFIPATGKRLKVTIQVTDLMTDHTIQGEMLEFVKTLIAPSP
jgi:hypothetical protein